MLVISRRANQGVVIDAGGGILVKVLGIDGSYVKLGVEAAPKVRVDREEVAERRRRKSENSVPQISVSP